MRILFIGDIVGSPGRLALEKLLPGLVRREKIDFVIANAENAAGGSGITPAIAEELFAYGVNVLTSGDHVWQKKELVAVLDKEKRILRPANYPAGCPGRGYGVYEIEAMGRSGPGPREDQVRNGRPRIGVINLVGRVFMDTLECPFRIASEIIDKIRNETPVIIVDMHAEATSEKIALSYYLDGRVSAVCGTHTHVVTADETVRSGGTAYISDVGMTGPFDGVIGRKKEQIIARFLTQMPMKFEMAEGDVRLQGAVIDVDEKSGRAKAIKRVEEKIA